MVPTCMRTARPLGTIIVMLFFSEQSACMQQDSNRVFYNATIWTGDTENPWAEAIALDGEFISEVGSTEKVRANIGSATEVIDLNGAFLVPGFIDSHTHFLTGGFQLASVDLRSSSSPDEFSERIEGFMDIS